MVVIDAAVRKLPGVLGAAEGPVDESFTSGLLEYPQYTRPGRLSRHEGPRGAHERQPRRHRALAPRAQSLARTAAAHPDLLATARPRAALPPLTRNF